jgi:hypothetical protein
LRAFLFDNPMRSLLVPLLFVAVKAHQVGKGAVNLVAPSDIELV